MAVIARRPEHRISHFLGETTKQEHTYFLFSITQLVAEGKVKRGCITFLKTANNVLAHV